MNYSTPGPGSLLARRCNTNPAMWASTPSYRIGRTNTHNVQSDSRNACTHNESHALADKGRSPFKKCVAIRTWNSACHPRDPSISKNSSSIFLASLLLSQSRSPRRSSPGVNSTTTRGRHDPTFKWSTRSAWLISCRNVSN